jgi:glycosyltransferase involved in cell wall biosynthesis
LKSLVNQTLHRAEFELIVVDGGSTDRTVEIAQDYADIVMQQKSKGVGGAMFSIGLFNTLMHVFAILKIFYFTIGSNTAFRRRAFLQVSGYSDMPAGEAHACIRDPKNILFHDRVKYGIPKTRILAGGWIF